MEYTSLIAEFCERYGMDRVEPDADGAVGFDVDGRPLVLQWLESSDAVLATVELGETPDAGAAVVNRLLMQANQTLFALDGMALVLNPENGHYRLMARLDVEALDFIGFDAKIARLLDRADQWGAFLEKFVPLAVEAEANGGDAPQPADVNFTDMLRV